MKKYELTNEYITYLGKKLYRIKALKNFGNVKIGELGGYIEKEDNLSQYDNAWVYGDARVFDEAIVKDNARVCGNAIVKDKAIVMDNARVCGDTRVFGNAVVKDKAIVMDNAWVCGDAIVKDKAKVCGDAIVAGNAIVKDKAKVFGDAIVAGNAIVKDNAWVYGNTMVFGDAIVKDKAKVCGDAWIESNADYLNISSLDSYSGYITFAKSRDNTILVHCDWFSGNIEEFEKRVLETISNNEQAKLYTFAIEMAKTRIKLEYK